MKENKIICSECGAILTNETSHEFERKTFCSENSMHSQGKGNGECIFA